MRKPPAKVTPEIEALLRAQARLRVPIISVKEIARLTGLHRNSVYNYIERFTDEGHKSNSQHAEGEAHSRE